MPPLHSSQATDAATTRLRSCLAKQLLRERLLANEQNHRESPTSPTSASTSTDGLARRMSEITMDSQAEEFEIDEAFFLETVVFLVEGCLFKIPKRNLEEQSHVFRDMFSVPADKTLPARDVEGSGISNPIRLEGISKESFRSFLRILCPRWLNEHILLTIPQWTSVLHLSHMWSFTHIRKRAISSLDVLFGAKDPISRILLGQTYDIPKWQFVGYVALAEREDALKVDEGVKLGVEDAVKLGSVREGRMKMKMAQMKEAVRRNNGYVTYGGMSPVESRSGNERLTSEQVLERETKRLVREAFGLRLQDTEETLNDKAVKALTRD